MALIALIALPFALGLLSLALARVSVALTRWVTLAGLMLISALAIPLLSAAPQDGPWLQIYNQPWLPSLGASWLFAGDGLSVSLALTSCLLGALCVAVSWQEIGKRVGLFHLCICWTVAACNGVFFAMDLILFIFFWEAMLVPSFLLIALYGHEKRESAAMKYLVFNQAGGIALIAAVLATGALVDPINFSAFQLSELDLSYDLQFWALLGFSAAFLVKLPTVPLHAWLPDAHTQAPTAGSILLAGLLLKTGAYGLYRFPALLFPDAAADLTPYMLYLGALSAIYGGVLAAGQSDGKRLVAYTSVAHMGFVLMGIFAATPLALTGAGVEMIAHALSASALFLMMGVLQERTGTRELGALGGLQRRTPRLALALSFFVVAALAMPGTANFVGEALVIFGVFQVRWPVAVAAAFGLILSVVYATKLLQGTVFGRPDEDHPLADLNARELAQAVPLILGILAIGLQPQWLINILEPSVDAARSWFAR